MANVSELVTGFLIQQLQSDTGVNAALEALRNSDTKTPQNIRNFLSRNVAAELLEKSNQALYPSVFVYCEKLSNTLVEKFRLFSGTARLVIELRNSADRLEAIESTVVYTGLICGVLSSMRGEWITGVSFNGAYEAAFSAVREGGKHFLQSSKVTFEVNVSE